MRITGAQSMQPKESVIAEGKEETEEGKEESEALDEETDINTLSAELGQF